jgi:hypothetical protein
VRTVEEFLLRTWGELVGRDSGPLHFRLVLQPMVAAVLAIGAGVRDARQGRPPFFQAFVRQLHRPPLLLAELWKDVGRLFLIAIALDLVYQLIVLQTIRPGQSVFVATVLAILPYLIVRGLTNRTITWLRHSPLQNRFTRHRAQVLNSWGAVGEQPAGCEAERSKRAAAQLLFTRAALQQVFAKEPQIFRARYLESGFPSGEGHFFKSYLRGSAFLPTHHVSLSNPAR